MISNLLLHSHKALKSCELRSLGHVNVLCGKNNSGKSTILEAASLESSRAFGLALSESHVAQIHKLTRGRMGWGETGPENNEFRQILMRATASRDVWYSSQRTEFLHEVRRMMEASPQFRRHAYDERPLLQAFLSLYTLEIKSVLLPPKRRLELSKQIISNEQAAPEGGGILNQLFFAKNQRQDAAEWQRYDEIRSFFSDISSGYSFEVFMAGPSNEVGLHFRYMDQPWIPARDCGLGLQDLLVLIWFSVSPEDNLILVEEPESHIHPQMQRKLLAFMAERADRQFLLSTHSNVFVNGAFANRVYFAWFDKTVHVEDATSRAAVLSDIGYDVTDNLVSDLVILVEGPSDVAFLEQALIKQGTIPASNVKLWPMGGDIMDKLDLSVFAQSYHLIALVDNDPGSSIVRDRFIRKCEAHGIRVHRLQRYAIENYLSLRAIQAVLGTQVPSSITSIDPNGRVEDQLGVSVRGNMRKIVQAMTVEELHEGDLGGFLDEVKTVCNSTLGPEG